MNSGIHRESESQDFELNLAPIIDCLTVLVTFMLASISFLAVGIIELSVANPGPATAGVKPPDITLEVELGLGGELVVRVSGKRSLRTEIKPLKISPAPIEEQWDIASLESEVERIKQEFPDTQSIVLSAKDDLEYLHYVRILEVMKSHFPLVLMGGFLNEAS